MDGGRGLAVQLLIEDRFQQRLERRGRIVETKSEWADAIDERSKFWVARAEMGDCLVGIEGKFAFAAVVNHGWSVSHADRTRAPVVHFPRFVRRKLFESGERISPFEVVASGNRHMHALQQGFRYESGAHSFAVDRLDSPIVALGERYPLLFSNNQPDLSKGLHSCLFNNCWGTNYIMWCGENLRAM